MISSPKASVSVPTAHVHSSNMVQNSCEMGVLRCWRALGSDRSCRPTPPHPARGGRSRTNAVCLGGWRALASAPSGCEARALASECGEGRPGWGPRSWALRRLGLQGLSALRRPNAGGRRGCSESHGAADTDVFSADTRAPCGLCPRHPGWGHTARFTLWLFSRSRQLVPFLVGPVCPWGCVRLDHLGLPEVHGDGRSRRGLAPVLSGSRVGPRRAVRLLSVARGCRWAPSSWALHLCLSGSVRFHRCLIFMRLGAFLLCVKAIIQLFLYIYRERVQESGGGQRRDGLWDSPLSADRACRRAPSHDPEIGTDESRTLRDGVRQGPLLQP